MDKQTLIRSVQVFVEIVQLLIITRILLTIIIRDLSNPILRFLYEITEPILAPFRNLFKMLGVNTGMFDFSPILAFISLNILSQLIINIVARI